MIRNYTANDKEGVLLLLKANTPRYFHQEEEQGFIDYLDHELEDYFVIEKQGSIVGAGGINYVPEEKTAYISWGMIHPHNQGEGLGRKLLQHRLNLLLSKSEIELIIVRTTQLTDKFYGKFGFELISIEKDYWAPGMDLYHMEMRNEQRNF